MGSAQWPGAEPGTEDPILNVLTNFKTLVVVGLSSKPSRPSHGVASYMQGRGYRIVPVNPNEQTVLGERSYATLDEVPDPVDVVVVFRRPEFVPGLVEAAIRHQAKVVWLQEGVVDEKAAQRARDAGMTVVMDRCILKEHAKRFVAGGI